MLLVSEDWFTRLHPVTCCFSGKMPHPFPFATFDQVVLDCPNQGVDNRRTDRQIQIQQLARPHLTEV